MTYVTIGLRLVVQAVFFFVIYPPQLLAMRFGWRLAGWLPTLFHRLFVRMFDLRIVERGTPPGPEPTLVLSNHTSWLDITVLGSLRPLSFIAKSEVAGWPVVGLFAKCQRSVFIERTRRSHTAKVNAASLWNLAQAPGTPRGVVIDTTQLTNATTLRWTLGTEADLAGYEVLWRETTAADWQHTLKVGKVDTVTIDLSKDNVFFGVRAVDATGHRSPAAAPQPSS